LLSHELLWCRKPCR